MKNLCFDAGLNQLTQPGANRSKRVLRVKYPLFEGAGEVAAGPSRAYWHGLLLLLATMLASTASHAHTLGQGYVYLSLIEDDIRGRYEITVPDLNSALGTELATDGSLLIEDLNVLRPAIIEYLESRIRLAPDGKERPLVFQDFELLSAAGAQYLGANFSLDGVPVAPSYIDFHYSVLFDVKPEHRGFGIVENDWKSGTFNNEGVISLIFDPQTTEGRLDLSSSTVAHGFWQMTRLGIHHIWIGIDHILFLIALLLPAVLVRQHNQWAPSPSFRGSLIYVVKIVTVFTIAHTITLSAATLGAISLSPRIVESVIAISIAIAAVEVLYPIMRGHIWWVVFVFGLFHGFGFASVLGDIGVPPAYMIHSLLAYNVGDELGQLAIVLVAFPLLYMVRQAWPYQRLIMPVGSVCLIVVSLYWFIERGFLIDLPAGEYANLVLGIVGLKL